MKTFKEFIKLKEDMTNQPVNPVVSNLIKQKVKDPKKKKLIDQAINTMNANKTINLGTAVDIEKMADKVND